MSPSSMHQTFDGHFISAPGTLPKHQSPNFEKPYTCPYDSEDWVSPANTLINTSPEAAFIKDDEKRWASPPKGPTSRNAITITIPLPWGKRSRRSSSVPAPSERRRRDESRDRLQQSPPLLQATRFTPSPVLGSSRPSHKATSSFSTNSSVPPTILSPVTERFEKASSSCATSIDPSPATPIDPSIQFPTIDPQPGPKEILRREGIHHIEFGVPLASHPVQPRYERSDSQASCRSQKLSPPLGLGSTAYMRSPSMSTGDGRRISPTHPARPRSPDPGARRAASVEPSRRPSESLRRDSGETTYSTSTAVSDDESVAGSADEKYLRSRLNWHGHAGGGNNGFYRAVVNDYKMVGRNVSEDVSKPRRSPKLKQEEFVRDHPAFRIVDDESPVAPQAMVPTGEELWG